MRAHSLSTEWIGIRFTTFCSVFLMVVSVLIAGQASAESVQVLVCEGDADCAPYGLVCIEGVCSSGDTCADSSTCEPTQYCNLKENSCPSDCEGDTECEERCQVPNGRCHALYAQACSADDECGDTSLCTTARPHTCAQGDERCEQTPKLVCKEVIFVLFCGPQDYGCVGDACNEFDRCVNSQFQEESESIIVNEDKDRTARIFQRDRLGEEEEEEGCSTVPMGAPTTPAHSGLLFALLGAACWLVRKRRKA